MRVGCKYLTFDGDSRSRESAVVSGSLRKRRDPPLLIASTLLVPGYIDEAEVSQIAGNFGILHVQTK